ncbi:aminotransferase class III-fold pyridoxal phosphate-dependent enzyme [Escherichia coli]|nr:aminotransferase class III-fold pyridoxal phosphate-dependent enzyme [Escherichia coli]
MSILISAGGIAGVLIPRPHPKVVAAVGSAVEKLSHTCFQVLAYEPYLELCEIMNQKVPAICQNAAGNDRFWKRWRTW